MDLEVRPFNLWHLFAYYSHRFRQVCAVRPNQFQCQCRQWNGNGPWSWTKSIDSRQACLHYNNSSLL